MSFNYDELVKIKNATDGFFGKKARMAIRAAVIDVAERITAAKKQPVAEQKALLLKLLNQKTYLRQTALRSGSASYSNPEWASAAVCESWLQELLMGDSEDIAMIELILKQITERS